MTILLLGPRHIADEWFALCAGHTCLYYGRNLRTPLPDHVRLLHAPDEAPSVDLVIDLNVRVSDRRLRLLADIHSEFPAVPLLCNTVAVTASELAAQLGGADASPRLTGMAALAGMSAAPIIEVCRPHGVAPALDPVLQMFFASIGREIEMVADEIGMVYARIIALIINEAVYAHQCGVASQADVDTAMTLGVNYPAGPFALGARISWKHLHALLTALHAELGDDRYRPATLLKKLAQA
jgi:3-hydroxybutyryl-CoA dehydrogenase